MKHGFTLVEVMFGNAMLLILVAGFVKITEQTLEQIQLKTLKNELKKHNPELIKRPSLLLLTKTDLIPTELLELEKVSKEIPIVQISSVSGKNLNEAIQSIAELIQSQTHDFEISSD